MDVDGDGNVAVDVRSPDGRDMLVVPSDYFPCDYFLGVPPCALITWSTASLFDFTSG